MRFIIVGAGFAGLTIAKKLHELHPSSTITIFEATGKIGGRLPDKIDHDEALFEDDTEQPKTLYTQITQVYTTADEPQKFHIYKNGNPEQLRNCLKFGDEYSSKRPNLQWHCSGTSDFIELLRPDHPNIRLHLNTRVLSITRNQGDLSVLVDNTAIYRAHKVYVTAPLPQFTQNSTYELQQLDCKIYSEKPIQDNIPSWGPIRAIKSISPNELEILCEPLPNLSNQVLIDLFKNLLNLNVTFYEIKAQTHLLVYRSNQKSNDAFMEDVYLFGDTYDNNPGWISNIQESINEHFLRHNSSASA